MQQGRHVEFYLRRSSDRWGAWSGEGAEEFRGGYAVRLHAISEGGWGRRVACCALAVPFDENSSNDQKERQGEGDGEGDEDDEAESEALTPTLEKVLLLRQYL